METLKYSNLILDFHGTVTDHQLRSIKSYHRAGHTAFGVHLGKTFYQEVLTRPSHSKNNGEGQKNKDFIRDRFQEQDSQSIEHFMRVFDKTMGDTFIPIPNVRATIRELLSLGVNVVLLTNGTKREAIRQTLRDWDKKGDFGIRPLAEKLYSSHLTGVRKPNEEAVNFIFRDMKSQGIDASPSNTLLVGDYRDDIQTGLNAGVDSVLFVRGNGQETFPLKDPRPTYVITQPSELIAIVKGERSPEGKEMITVEPVLWTGEGWYKKHE